MAVNIERLNVLLQTLKQLAFLRKKLSNFSALDSTDFFEFSSTNLESIYERLCIVAPERQKKALQQEYDRLEKLSIKQAEAYVKYQTKQRKKS